MKFFGLKQLRGRIGAYRDDIGKYRLEYPANAGKFSAAFTFTVLILGVFWIILITIVNVAAVGYELVPFISTSYNGSANLWYERLLPDKWKPETRSCEASTFLLGQSGLPARHVTNTRSHDKHVWALGLYVSRLS